MKKVIRAGTLKVPSLDNTQFDGLCITPMWSSMERTPENWNAENSETSANQWRMLFIELPATRQPTGTGNCPGQGQHADRN